jgi:hypothetical protein
MTASALIGPHRKWPLHLQYANAAPVPRGIFDTFDIFAPVPTSTPTADAPLAPQWEHGEEVRERSGDRTPSSIQPLPL